MSSGWHDARDSTPLDLTPDAPACDRCDEPFSCSLGDRSRIDQEHSYTDSVYMKNVTLALDQAILREARRIAAERSTTVNAMVRDFQPVPRRVIPRSATGLTVCCPAE